MTTRRIALALLLEQMYEEVWLDADTLTVDVLLVLRHRPSFEELVGLAIRTGTALRLTNAHGTMLLASALDSVNAVAAHLGIADVGWHELTDGTIIAPFPNPDPNPES